MISLQLGWLLVSGRVGWLRGGIALALAGAWLIVVRWYLLPGLPTYLWVLNIGTVIAALRDQRSLLSLVTAGAIVIPLAVLAWRHVPDRVRPLKGILLMMAVSPL